MLTCPKENKSISAFGEGQKQSNKGNTQPPVDAHGSKTPLQLKFPIYRVISVDIILEGSQIVGGQTERKHENNTCKGAQGKGGGAAVPSPQPHTPHAFFHTHFLNSRFPHCLGAWNT